MEEIKHGNIKKYKKGKNIIILLVLIILGLGGFIVYDKVINKETPKPVKTYEKKEVKEDLDEIAGTLFNKINKYNIDQFDAYEENMTFTENPNNNQMVTMLYNYWIDQNKEEVSKEEVDNYFKEIYGITLNNYPDIMCKVDSTALFKYDSNNQKYVPNQQHLGHDSDSVKSLGQIVTDIKKENDNYILTLAKLYAGSMMDETAVHYYSDGRNSNTITVLDQFINSDTTEGNDAKALEYFTNHKEDFKDLKPKYKYTFKKENDDYYLIAYEVLY